MVHKPLHDCLCLWVENKLAAFQPHRGVLCHTLACHYLFDVGKRKVLYWFLPNGAMLAARLAFGGGVEHQCAQFLVARSQNIVEV